MRSEWRTVRLADAVEFNPALKLSKGQNATKISMDCLQPFTRHVYNYSMEKYNGGMKFQNGDTIMARITPCLENGKTAYVDVLADSEVGFGSTEYIVWRAKKGITDPQFVYYLAISPEIRNVAIKSMVGSSGRQRVQQSVLDGYEILLPSVSEQKVIGRYLAMLDERIEMNNSINDNLEQQAATLITNYCDSTSDSIPLGEIMSFENGFAFQSKTYLSSGQYRIITIKNVLDGKINSQGAAYIDDAPSRMKTGCFLIPGDVLLSLTGNVGRTGIVCEENLLLNQRVAKIVPADITILPWLYYYFRLPSTKVSLETIAKGTAQQNLSPVETLKLQVPFEMSSAKELSQVLYPMFRWETANEMESLCLADLRDTLLPRLMAGELDVSGLDL